MADHFDVWRAITEAYQDPMFDGPWATDAPLIAAFLAFSERELPELSAEYGAQNNAAYCIELLLADLDPDDHIATLVAFFHELPPELARRGLGMIASDLEAKGDPATEPLRRDLATLQSLL